jgi:lipid II:glycine glycyltransferase (peptidoglycan interpeptide bridge formation enzyme)
MSTIVEVDLKEILTKIDQKLDHIEQDLTQLKIGQESLKGNINVLDEKVTGLSKRLENQEFTGRGILIALIVALIGGAAKLFGWIPST